MGHVSEHEYQHTSELLDHGATLARVTYREDALEVASELLDLDPADRSESFATRLTDGSLVERLPIGHAHGRWRLRWVRSDVPGAELDAEDDEDLAMPHERFVRLRTAGALVRPVGASGALGGSIQYFDVEVPDSVASLAVEYVVGSELVDVETVALPVGRA